MITRNLRREPARIAAGRQVDFWITGAGGRSRLRSAFRAGCVLGLMGPNSSGRPRAAIPAGGWKWARRAVVARRALIYPGADAAIWRLSLGTIVLQALLTVIGMHVDDGFNLSPFDRAFGRRRYCWSRCASPR